MAAVAAEAGRKQTALAPTYGDIWWRPGRCKRSLSLYDSTFMIDDTLFAHDRE